jgi:hypothetical protein
MRPLPVLGVVAGLAMIGWGGYALYAAFVGGPPIYWGKDQVDYLADLEQTLTAARTDHDREQREIRDLREKLPGLPAGAARDDAEKSLAELTHESDVHEKVLTDSDRLLAAKLDQRDVAKGRAIVRGFVFPVLGLICLVRAGWAILRPTRRTPSTVRPGPLPPSPRPGG